MTVNIKEISKNITNEIISSLEIGNFFVDEDIPNKGFAIEYLNEIIEEKLVKKFENEGGENLESGGYFTEEEFITILNVIIIDSRLGELETKGFISSFEDENGDELFFLTELGKDYSKKLNIDDFIDGEI